MCEGVPSAEQEMQVSKGGLSQTPGWKAVAGTRVLHTTLHERQQLDWNGVS